MTNSLYTLSYGTTDIKYLLSFSDRKTLQVAVYPDQTVSVVAPENATIEKIQEKVRKKASWILKQQRYFKKFRSQKEDFEYVSGETHKYLGRQYRLKVIESNEEETVKLKGGYFRINTTEKNNPERVKKLLNNWYRLRAEIRYAERIDKCVEFLKAFKIPVPEFKIQKMNKRWGSFTPSGYVLLNPELIKYPLYCIDYVIIHEMCHAKYKNHSKDFYNLLSTVLPDWEYRKKRLEEMD